MKTLDDALLKYFKSATKVNDDWYKWKIDVSKLPIGISISLPNGNDLKKNIFLKNALSKEFLKASDVNKVRIICYYISIWGGVRGNSCDNFMFYALDKTEDIFKKRTSGIASWSKALCIRNPNRYAIYDSRVAVALNALQIKSKIENPTLFPLVPGRGKGIKNSIPLIKQHAIDEGWPKQNANDFYDEYNQLISKVAKKCEVEHAKVEMLLFSKAMDLVKEAFPGQVLN